MRKRFSDYQPKTPAKKRFVSPPSSPLHPVPKFTEQSPSNRPSFNPVGGLPFDRKIRPGLPQNAFDIFALFCPDSMVEEWANYVNLRRDGPDWRPTSKEEIYLFFGVFLYMSYSPLSSIDLYWETSDIATSYPITRFISRNRFLDIYRRFCTWDPTEHISSVFEKVKPWSTHIKDVSKHWWRPSSNISVDEAMIRFTGRSKDIVRLPNKPVSVGYKIWITADSGFIIDFMYHSKDKGPIDYSKATCPKLAPTQGVVVNMLAKLPPAPTPNHKYHCFLDNLFSSPKLMDRLREMDIAATGTTRPNRVDSKQLSTMKSSEKSRDRIPWGTVYARKHKEEEVMQVGFKDNAFVLLLSTAFDGWEQPVERLRRQPAKTSTSAKTAREPFKGQSTMKLEIPHIIDQYNHNMNGVDIADQLRSEHTPRWRMRRGGQQALLYLFLFGIAVTNSHLLQLHSWPSPIPTMDAFRRRLCSEILNKFGAKAAMQATNSTTATPTSMPHESTRREVRQFCAFCFSKRRNWLLEYEQLQAALPQKHKIITGCKACGVNLCDNSKRRCFRLWHDALEERGAI